MNASSILARLRQAQAPLRGPRWLHLATTAVVLLVGLLLPLQMAPYINFDLSMVMLFTIGALGLNLLTGYTGQISLGHSAFVALGAYTSALLIKDGWNYLLVLPVAMAASFVLGYLVGRPALRLQGLQLALVTLGLALITPPAIKRLGSITEGQEGINIFTVVAPDWSGLADDQWVYYLTLVGLVLTWVVSRRLTEGRIGRSLIAVRDNETVARTLGVDTAGTKTMIFAISSAMAGAAGTFYVYAVQFVGPDSFGLTMAIAFLSIIVIGGIGTVPGAILGALFVHYVPKVTEDINQSASGFVYGIALILVVFLMPHGLLGLVRGVLRPVVSQLSGRRRKGGVEAAGRGLPLGAQQDG